jgi:hypothetical protein
MGVAHILGGGLLIYYMFLHMRHLIDATIQPAFKTVILLYVHNVENKIYSEEYRLLGYDAM